MFLNLDLKQEFVHYSTPFVEFDYLNTNVMKIEDVAVKGDMLLYLKNVVCMNNNIYAECPFFS